MGGPKLYKSKRPMKSYSSLYMCSIYLDTKKLVTICDKTGIIMTFKGMLTQSLLKTNSN